MGRYGFSGGGAQQAIQEFLVQRALQQRQAQQDARAQQEQERQATQQAEELKLRQEQEKRAAEFQKTQTADLQNQREFTKATTIANAALPGDAVDQPTREMLGRQGYGGQIKQTPGIVAQGAFQGNDAQDIPQYDVTTTPDSYTMRGGSQYLSARAAADERSADAAANRTAVDARDKSDNALKLLIAEMAQSGKAGQTDLMNQLRQLQIDRERDKLDASRQGRTDINTATANTRRQIRDLATGLLNDPSLEAISGAFDAMTPDVQPASRDAANRYNQLKNLLTLGKRGDLKGQGQVSNWEGQMVEKGASALDRAAGAANVRAHLQEIIDAFQGDTPREGPNTTGGSSFRVVGRR